MKLFHWPAVCSFFAIQIRYALKNKYIHMYSYIQREQENIRLFST